jgi:hypothetical protein
MDSVSYEAQPPPKRYKKRDETPLVQHGGDEVIKRARNLRAAKDNPVLYDRDKVRMDEAGRTKMLGELTKMLKESFMSEHQVYFLITITLKFGAKMEVLLSGFSEMKKLEEHLKTCGGVETFIVRAFVEDEEREMLFSAANLDMICHLNDVDYVVDELIVKFGVIFYFIGDAAAAVDLLSKITQKPSSQVSNLEMQYLRRFCDGLNAGSK